MAVELLIVLEVRCERRGSIRGEAGSGVVAEARVGGVRACRVGRAERCGGGGRRAGRRGGLVGSGLVLLPSPGPVLVVGVLSHMDDPEPLRFLHERPPVLRCERAPLFTWKIKNENEPIVFVSAQCCYTFLPSGEN